MKRTLLAVLLAGLAAAGLLAQQAAPQAPPVPPPVTFRVEINYVEVDAIVTDASGNIVSNLRREDFQVLEDGKPQKISAFSLVNIPIERAERPLFAAAPIEPDVRSNATMDGRLYVIVLDDYHVDITRVPRVKAAMRRFIEGNFGVNDLAAVVYTSGRANDGQDFTNSQRLLLASIDKFTGRKLRSSTLERIEAYNRSTDTRQQGQRVNDPLEFERAYQARQTMGAIRRIAEFMAGIHGRRKAMLLVSEGIDYDIYDVFNNREASTILDDSREAIAAATRGNVSVYAVDPRGLTTLGDDLIETGSLPQDTSLGLGVQSSQAELRIAQDSLRVLADETGGFAVLNQNDFSSGFDRMVQENSSYYVLGYYPANDRRDGKYRKLEVRVNRPGLQVRSRKGYVAPRGRAPETKRAGDSELPAAVREALESPLPMGGIPMSVFAAPYKGTAPNAVVAIAIEMGASGFTFVEQGGTFNDRLDVAITATDLDGKLYGSTRHGIAMAMKPDTAARAKARGIRMVSQIEVPPGRYQLHVAAGEGGGKVGSVLYDLEVPDFSKAPLTMSGVTLTSAAAAETTTVSPKNSLSDFLPGPPITTREFDRSDTIALFTEFYENRTGVPPHKIDLSVSVRGDDGRVVLENHEERASTELQGGRGGYGFTATFPLKDFAPGLYVLHVEARMRGADAGVGRDIQFRVR